MKKHTFNAIVCITILFVSNWQLGNAKDKEIIRQKEVVTLDFDTVNNQLIANTAAFTDNKTNVYEWKELDKKFDVNENIVYLPELKGFNEEKEIKHEIRRQMPASVRSIEKSLPKTKSVVKEEVVKSVWVNKATITRNIGGEENNSRTVFKNGKVLNYDLDKWINDISDTELLYRLVQAEAGGESSLGRRLVADCVLNMSRTMNISVKMAILNPGIFDVVSSGSIFLTTPSESTIQCVDTELKGQIDYGVMYFRTGHFHNFGIPYDQVGNHYFSKAVSDEVSQWHE